MHSCPAIPATLLDRASRTGRPLPGDLADDAEEDLQAEAQALDADALVVAVDGAALLLVREGGGEAVGRHAQLAEGARVGEANAHGGYHQGVLDVLPHDARDDPDQLVVQRRRWSLRAEDPLDRH